MQHSVDTLYMDSEMLDDLASQDEFNYSRELVHKESESIWDYLEKWLRQFFQDDSDYQFLKEYGEWIVGIVLFVAVVVAIIIYFKNHPELFDKRLKDGNLDYQVGVDLRSEPCWSFPSADIWHGRRISASRISWRSCCTFPFSTDRSRDLRTGSRACSRHWPARKECWPSLTSPARSRTERARWS